MALRHSNRHYITLPWFYFTLHNATMALLHYAILYITLPYLYFTLLDTTFLYHCSSSP